MGTEAKVAKILESPQWVQHLSKQFKHPVHGVKYRADLDSVTRTLHDNELPPMYLVAAKELEGSSIPRSSETKRRVLAEKVDQENSVTFFVSHRWLTDTAPDDNENSKAKTLYNFAEWWSSYWHGKERKTPLKVYFWIDYACIDQDDKAEGILCLPLYISACGGIVECMRTTGWKAESQGQGYYTRGWCLLEANLAFKYQIAGAAPFVLGVGWDFPRLNKKEYQAQLKEKDGQFAKVKSYAERFLRFEKRGLLRASKGNLREVDDKDYIEHLEGVVESIQVYLPERKQGTKITYGGATVEARVLTA